MALGLPSWACGGGTSSEEKPEKIIKRGLGRNQFYLSREWPYKNVKPRIIIERYLENRKSSMQNTMDNSKMYKSSFSYILNIMNIY